MENSFTVVFIGATVDESMPKRIQLSADEVAGILQKHLESDGKTAVRQVTFETSYFYGVSIEVEQKPEKQKRRGRK